MASFKHLRFDHFKCKHFAYHFLNGIGDEDEGDEARETLLCEAGHVLDDVAGI